MKKVENKQEEVKVTYDQKLMNNIKELEKSVQKSANETQQLLGALDYARFAYSEYMKEIQPQEVKTE